MGAKRLILTGHSGVTSVTDDSLPHPQQTPRDPPVTSATLPDKVPFIRLPSCAKPHRLNRDHSAIHHQLGAGDKAAVIGGQKDDGFGGETG